MPALNRLSARTKKNLPGNKSLDKVPPGSQDHEDIKE
jgi:hypothetical protein